jgi:NADPH-ferrihemoprotein reductase
LKSLVGDPEDIEAEDLTKVPSNKLIIFVVSTYGEGEPTDNCVGLHEWLQNQSESLSDGEEKPLSNLHYAIFGLGNKTYERFNQTARNIDKWCTSLGATRVGQRGEGDDDGSLEDDFISWKETIWTDIAAFMGIDLAAAAEAASGDSLRSFKILSHSDSWVINAAKKHVYRGELGDPNAKSFDSKNPFYAKVLRSRELFSGKEPMRNCIHLEFDLAGSRLNYQAGDHLAIWPENKVSEVEKLTGALNIQGKLDEVFSMNATDPASRKMHPFPCPTTFRAALTNYLDICTPPKPHILQSWVAYLAPNSVERNFYSKLASDKEVYAREVTSCHATIADLLEKHPAPTLPVDVVLEGLTRVQPRYYSISSSPRYLATQKGGSSTQVHITATVLRYESPSKNKVVTGLTTGYLYDIHCKLQSDSTISCIIPVSIRHSSFKLPRQLSTPIIMIGPGTGVAPFRGFIQDREAAIDRMKDSSSNGKTVGETFLFYGCRHKEHDYLYSEEWKGHLSSGALTNLEVAFSRDQASKEYVQHKLSKNQDKIWAILQQGGHIYICGDAKHMARDVNQWFLETARDLGKLPDDKAARYLKDLRNRGRFLEDVWS